jgi:uncharacterized membrane protein
MMRWSWNPQGFDGWDHHLGAAGVVGFVLMIVLWAAVIAALVLGIRALILHSRRNRVSALPGTTTQYTAPPVVPTPTEVSTGAPIEDGKALVTGNPTALAILEERYARGDIDRDEFLQRKQDLGLT